MTRPWQLVDSADTPEGRLELRRRAPPAAGGVADYVISIGGRVLMASGAHHSETAAAELACRPLAARPRPRVLLGGLGMGFTLRAALDVLPRAAAVLVAEIDPVIVRWCHGPLASLTSGAASDSRVTIQLVDVASLIAAAASSGARAVSPAAGAAPNPRFDAIVLDLYEGPRQSGLRQADSFYGHAALARTRSALTPNGFFAVWSEQPDPAFERRLTAAAFTWRRHRPAHHGNPRHLIYLARPRPR